jgi:CheY-like chemotaxis protein
VPVPAPKTILVLEDEVLVRMAVADDLMSAGFHVIQAASADEALRLLLSPAHVDLVLTDINMPGSFDGLALAAGVRATWPALKIIVLSGDLPAEPAADLADAFLSKPHNVAVLLGRVNQLLSD